MIALKECTKHYKSKIETTKDSGIRRKQSGGDVIFFSDVKQLLKKLELVTGKILTGNTSIELLNMGVALLDT